MIKSKKVRGRLIDHGLTIEKHERATVDLLLAHGNDVELLLPSNTMGNSNPDLMMWGVIWEMKSPIVASRASLSRLFRHATKQSCNVIFDLRRIKIKNDNELVRVLQSFLETSRRARRLIVITHAKELLDFAKNKS